jgi:hypothetical protein
MTGLVSSKMRLFRVDALLHIFGIDRAPLALSCALIMQLPPIDVGLRAMLVNDAGSLIASTTREYCRHFSAV